MHAYPDTKRVPTLQEIYALGCNSVLQGVLEEIIKFRIKDKIKKPFQNGRVVFQNEMVI